METAIELGKIKGIILDFRSNPGGLLDQAVEVSDLFLTKGRIVSTNGRHPDSNQNFYADEDEKAQNLPMAVLINGNTASAAEIVAAALQDHGRAIVIGSNSYGKGTVQNVIALPNNSELSITWSRFYTPSGYALHNLGVLPTICTSRENIGASGKENSEFIRRLKKFHAGVVISKAVFSQWRAKKLPGKESIEKLRAICPARKKTSDQDLNVAKQLLSDPMIYSRAMNLSFPAVAN
jgi:carboxyl-terminal processing protease